MKYGKQKTEIELYNFLKNITSPNKYAIEKLPKIKKEDTKRGWIDRYFLKQSNNIHARIIEIDKTQFNKFKNEPFYDNINIRWKITGNKLEIADVNSRVLEDANDDFNGILNKLQNDLLKFESNDF